MEEQRIVTSPVKAIRHKCLDCSCGSSNEVKACAIEHCPLYPFRFGKNPYRPKKEYTEEQKQAFRERMLNSRISK